MPIQSVDIDSDFDVWKASVWGDEDFSLLMCEKRADI